MYVGWNRIILMFLIAPHDLKVRGHVELLCMWDGTCEFNNIILCM